MGKADISRLANLGPFAVCPLLGENLQEVAIALDHAKLCSLLGRLCPWDACRCHGEVHRSDVINLLKNREGIFSDPLALPIRSMFAPDGYAAPVLVLYLIFSKQLIRGIISAAFKRLPPYERPFTHLTSPGPDGPAHTIWFLQRRPHARSQSH